MWSGSLGKIVCAGWACPTCTYINATEGEDAKCGMCSANKPGALPAGLDIKSYEYFRANALGMMPYEVPAFDRDGLVGVVSKGDLDRMEAQYYEAQNKPNPVQRRMKELFERLRFMNKSGHCFFEAEALAEYGDQAYWPRARVDNMLHLHDNRDKYVDMWGGVEQLDAYLEAERVFLSKLVAGVETGTKDIVQGTQRNIHVLADRYGAWTSVYQLVEGLGEFRLTHDVRPAGAIQHRILLFFSGRADEGHYDVAIAEDLDCSPHLTPLRETKYAGWPHRPRKWT